jgi:hypothetical protein
MSRVLFSLLTLLSLLFSEEITLAKDELYRTVIKDDVRDKNLYFKWVIFKNDALNVVLNYDRFNYQFTLYRDFYKNSFMLDLSTHKLYYKRGKYLYLQFIEFKDNKAKFNLYIKN